jgi:hypothetical protein
MKIHVVVGADYDDDTDGFGRAIRVAPRNSRVHGGGMPGRTRERFVAAKPKWQTCRRTHGP